MKKTLPDLLTDEAAEEFVANADLSDYDLSGFKPVTFEIARKDARVNMRLPTSLIAAVKAKAGAEGMPYQRYIRRALEVSLDNKGSANTGAPEKPKSSA